MENETQKNQNDVDNEPAAPKAGQENGESNKIFGPDSYIMKMSKKYSNVTSPGGLWFEFEGLCRRAGFPPSQLINAYDNLFSLKSDVDISDHRAPLPPIPLADLLHCPKCNNLLHPDVVKGIERISETHTDLIRRFVGLGFLDLMLVVGPDAIMSPLGTWKRN
ncbi:hypothetical protein K504DRAFT_530084 [Pleomassaria siparia CBS 279.74]|uniref:Uncharacterized protein n=1 Tax=Pleomassaria siparia CBS 279.74 TaxID=1314801 RepID=A0A6G1KJK4_9PLEO|nr:hypothetical protein K504DRAFT_530084 [Pleomassaria siparia CBS 279.74]